VGRHLISALKAYSGNLIGPNPQGCPGRIHCNVAAADYNDPFPDAGFLTQGHLLEQVQAQEYAFGIYTLNRQAAALSRPHRNQNGVVPILDLRQGYVLANHGISYKFYPFIKYELCLSVNNLLWQAITGNARPHHPAGLLQAVIDCHAKASLAKVKGGGQSSGARADNTNRPTVFFIVAALRGLLSALLDPIFPSIIGGRPLQGTDRYWFSIFLYPVALILAGMVTDSSTDPREGHAAMYHLEGLRKLPLGDQGYIALGVGPSGTGVAARCYTPLLNHVGIGNCLREEPVDGLIGRHPLIEGVVDLNGADLLTVAAGGTLIYIHIAWFQANPGLEIARVSCEILKGSL